MLQKEKRSIYFLMNPKFNSTIDRFVQFLSDDINFLYLDTSNTKEVIKHSLNHKYVQSDDFIETILGNRRNLDHIILYIPFVYKSKYISEVKVILEGFNIPFSIITSIRNINDIDNLTFDSIYLVNDKEITKDDEIITYDSYTMQYIRTARINNIIDSND